MHVSYFIFMLQFWIRVYDTNNVPSTSCCNNRAPNYLFAAVATIVVFIDVIVVFACWVRQIRPRSYYKLLSYLHEPESCKSRADRHTHQPSTNKQTNKFRNHMRTSSVWIWRTSKLLGLHWHTNTCNCVCKSVLALLLCVYAMSARAHINEQ